MIKNFFTSITSWGATEKSGKSAKNRLELVLAHDRAGVNPELIEKMRLEILEVVSRYLDIDIEEMDFSIQSSDRTTSLKANLPIKKIKRNQEN
ncbi:cell division topological specificity factor MinE [Cyanobacterium stanieri LEGE 03274]|uniref:Cell division topological specificity factor n=1 Tax=Cyanobacterium stanieri LEGE 03274 TaxID=1828756 RepID=A0ABR9V757_9CHRO|nr:cell division topological specificity factor MinE [Cyanobacterium stanieri]MBE9222664.1 cell division topological specificity factor MinE [Cyanobacterium stanieri LEGE 03274]